MATYGGAPYGGSAYAGAFSSVTGTLGLLYNTVLDPAQIPVPNVPVTAKLMPVPGFRSSTGNTEVARQVDTTSNSAGYWELPLEANSNITPSGTYYEITEYIPVVDGGPRVWLVRVTANVVQSVFSSKVVAL